MKRVVLRVKRYVFMTRLLHKDELKMTGVKSELRSVVLATLHGVFDKLSMKS